MIPSQDAFHKRRARFEASIESLIGVFASQSTGYDDDMLVLDSTPVETARSRETVKRAGDSQLADAIGDAAGYGYCSSHSRFYYGMRLHLLAALDGTPSARRHFVVARTRRAGGRDHAPGPRTAWRRDRPRRQGLRPS